MHVVDTDWVILAIHEVPEDDNIFEAEMSEQMDGCCQLPLSSLDSADIMAAKCITMCS